MNNNTISKIMIFIAMLWLSIAQVSAEVIDKVIAQVEEDVILQSELDRKIQQVTNQIQTRGGQLPPADVLKKELLEQIIVDNLQLQMAKRSGMNVSEAELQQIVTTLAQRNGMDVEQWRLQLAQQGIPYQLFLNDIRDEVLISRFREAFVSRKIQISEKEIDSLVANMNENSQVRYQLGHILIAVPEDASEDLIEEKQQVASEIIQKLNNGELFSDLAIAHSDGQKAATGGDFGIMRLSDMPTLFAEKVSFLKAGEVSRPFTSPSGIHILQLQDIIGKETHLVEQKHARHILIRTDKITTDGEAEKLLNNIRDQVNAGADFAELAKKHSNDPGSANLGGDLGWKPAGVYEPSFEGVLQSLSVNQVSEPFKGQYGWHIIELLGVREQDQTDEMKREQAAKILHQRKFTEEAENWLRELRDQAYVKKVVEEEA